MNYSKELCKLIKDMAHRHSVWEVFCDFIAMFAFSLSNAVDGQQRETRERQYMEIVKKYEKRDIDKFPEMAALVMLAMEKAAGDILGKVYGEIGLSNKWVGQFFTFFMPAGSTIRFIFGMGWHSLI